MADKTHPTGNPTLAAQMQEALRRASHAPAYATATKTQEKVAPKVAAQTRVEEEAQPEVNEKAALDLKIKQNLFYQAFEENSQLSQEEQIMLLANSLDPKQQTKEKLAENYSLFQEYFTFMQSDDLEKILENVTRLINEVKSRENIEIVEMLKNLNGMLADTEMAGKMVEVLRKARLSGQTVKELSDAVARNDQIHADLTALEGETTATGKVVAGKKSAAEAEVKAAEDIVAAATKERNAQEATWGHWGKSLIKKDTTYSDRVTEAQTLLDEKKAALNEVNTKIEVLKTQRNEEFEREPLIILRSLDQANSNLSDFIVSAGEKGIKTVRGEQQSVLQQIGRANFSEAEIDRIGRRVDARQVVLSNVKSGLEIASKNTDTYKLELMEKSATAEAALAAAKAPEEGAERNFLDEAKKQDAAVRLKNEVKDVTEYQTKLNGTVQQMTGTVSKNVERSQETERQKDIIRGSKDSITTFGRDTLNTVADNLEFVLHNILADQTDETQGTLAAFAKAADTMKLGALDKVIARGADIHDRRISGLDASIARIRDTTALIAKAVTTSVDQGTAIAEKEAAMAAATQDYDLAATTMRTVVGMQSNAAVHGDPTRPAAQTSEAKASEANNG